MPYQPVQTTGYMQTLPDNWKPNPEYSVTNGIGQQGFDKYAAARAQLEGLAAQDGPSNPLGSGLSSGLADYGYVPNYPPPLTTTATSRDKTAYEILEDIARRGIESPHNLPEAEIQILAAFVLGHTS